MDKLPDDVRPHVERLLGRDFLAHFSTDALPGVAPPGYQVVQPRVLQERIELRRDSAEKKALDEYKKALDELRQEVKELKERMGAAKPEGA